MRNFLFGTAIAFVMFVIATGFNQDPSKKVVSRGSKVTQFQIENSASQITLGIKHDYYTLITFWESNDAPSRYACSEYTNILKRSDKIRNKVKFVAINFDESETLRDEIIKVDGMDVSSQYSLDADNRYKVASSFGLSEGMGSVLIAPDGTVVTFNPTFEFLSAL